MAILSFDALAQYRGLVTLVDGSFDPIHPGHLAYFRAARSLGYSLLCNICPDSETAKKHPVLLPAPERAQILDSLDILQYVHVSERPTVDVLRQLRPAFYVKGRDWLNRLPVEQGQVCDELGIRIRFTDSVQQSSSALLAKFQPDVDAFEKLVQSQPTPDDWQPVTDYREETRMPLERPQAEIIANALRPESVLDYGCGFGYLLRALREVLPKAYLKGYDRNMGTHCVLAGGIEMTYDEPFDTRFDLVVCRETLEHCALVEWRRVVSSLCALTRKHLYITTRFNPTPRHLLDVQLSDDLDPTHCTLPPQDLLRALIVLEGFKRCEYFEHRLDWRQQGRVLCYERVA